MPVAPSRVAQTAFPTIGLATFLLRTPSGHFVLLQFSIPLFQLCYLCVVAGINPSMPFEARVKSVLSGDTVVLSHVTNPAQERILSLAYVSAPRLRREGDEVNLFNIPIVMQSGPIEQLACLLLCKEQRTKANAVQLS